MTSKAQIPLKFNDGTWHACSAIHSRLGGLWRFESWF